ncbi:uncharacterized protein SRS1_14247 [Sporisorium reilianum f. sp. reilianum]|uniref:C2 NT-type domain-containing protein n=1 Tax=Sporisorium reilianum f. sp. reilianum TaxID=72559 RepID=A0A2N8UFA6_9BASI|nr:uncharacterized protein SRS1_14247 [Sporisorium reilianum f. sp. reilianum]
MSLLAPFGFGQKHSYFHVQLTIHEITNVPLVTGLFACKWKFPSSHSLASLQHAAAAAVHQQTSQTVSSAARKAHSDHHSGASNHLAPGPPHQHASSSTSDADASQHASHKHGLLNHLIHPSQHRHHDDSASQSASPAPPAQGSSRASLTSAAEQSESATSSPVSRKDSITSHKTSNSRTKTFKDLLRPQASDQHHHNVDPLLFFTQEPKGETDFVMVHDHKVEWERDLQVGMRIAIGKPKTSSPSTSRHDSPAVSAKSSAKDLRSRSQRDQHLDDLSTAWGRLTNSELKLTIKQQMPAHEKSTSHPSTLGHVVLDLSEFAPNPPATTSRERRRQQRHPNYHSHHIRHHHGPGGEHSYRDRVCRTEMRKFLLNNSKTNATVKITISMTYLGGTREYYVPPISNGLMVNGLGSLMAPALLEANRAAAVARHGTDPASSHSASSDDSSLANEPVRASADVRNLSLMGSGLPSASSFTLNHGNSSLYSQHSLYGPPLKSIYTKRTWTNRIPEENLVAAASGSEAAKKKPHRSHDSSFLSGRSQAGRAPEDVVNAIFKGIPVGGSHLGQAQDEAAAAKAVADRKARAKAAAAYIDSQTYQLLQRSSKSPERSRSHERERTRTRTVSTASHVSKKSERSFSFGLTRSKDKDKDKGKGKEKEKERKEKEKEKAKAKKDSKKDSKGSGTNTHPEPASTDKAPSRHLSVPGSNAGKLTPGPLVESPSASTDTLQRTNGEAPSGAPSGAMRSSTKRLSSVRWNLGGSGDAWTRDARSSQETTPVAETLSDKEAQDRAAMPPPPSVVVDQAYIPVRAGGITAASLSSVDVTANASSPGATKATQSSDDARLSPLLPKDSATASRQSSGTNAPVSGKKVSSSDLNALYHAELTMPPSLSNNATVGLERLRRTSRHADQFAMDASKASRSLSRPGSSSGAQPAHDSQGVAGRERRSKGNRGIEPSEAASNGWQGAGWLRPISTAPAPLPPCSDSSSSSEDDSFEDEDFEDARSNRFGSLVSLNSDDGRNLPDTPDTPRPSTSEPPREREPSSGTDYHDVDGEHGWDHAGEPVKASQPAMATAGLGVYGSAA